MAYLISISDKCLFMDSFAQHTAAVLQKPSVVCWIANTPMQFGYEMHTNIIANKGNIKPDTRNSVYNRFDISGIDVQCPYNSQNDIFDVSKIVATLRSEKINEIPKTINKTIASNK